MTEEEIKKLVLDRIASGEAPDYKTIHGGKKFEGFSDHPRVPIPLGNGQYSTAAGRYQFVAPTWDEEASRLGLEDFSPESQDKAAWDLAKRTYQQATGRSITSDVEKGSVDWTSLGSQWESLKPKAGGMFVEPVDYDPFEAGGFEPNSLSMSDPRIRLKMALEGRAAGYRIGQGEGSFLDYLTTGARAVEQAANPVNMARGLFDFAKAPGKVASGELQPTPELGAQMALNMDLGGASRTLLGGEGLGTGGGRLRIDPIEHDPFAGVEAPGTSPESVLLDELKARGMTAEPMPHDPFEGTPVMHVGGPTDASEPSAFGGHNWHQQQYSTAEGGRIEYTFRNGKPHTAFLRSPEGKVIKELPPHKIQFPENIHAPKEMHVGEPVRDDRTQTQRNKYRDVTYRTADGARIEFNYVNSKPDRATLYSSDRRIRQLTPQEVKFPPLAEATAPKTVHVGDTPTSTWITHLFAKNGRSAEYPAPNGTQIIYNWDSQGNPLRATWQGRRFSPEEVKFPPMPVARGTVPPSSVGENWKLSSVQRSRPGDSPSPNQSPRWAVYDLPGRRQLTFHWQDGVPWFAVQDSPKGGYRSFQPNEITFPELAINAEGALRPPETHNPGEIRPEALLEPVKEELDEGSGPYLEPETPGAPGGFTMRDFHQAGYNVNRHAYKEVTRIWNKNIKMPPEEFVASFFGGHAKHLSIDVFEENTLGLDASLYEGDKQIGTVSRTINFVEGTAHHSYLRFYADIQGGGYGKKLLAAQMAQYQRMGLTKVDLFANINVGGYAWAKYGFVPEKSGYFILQNYMTRCLEGAAKSMDIAPEIYDKLQVLINDKDPKTVWAISDSPLGKTLLKDSAWNGELRLGDKESMERFNAYVSKGK